MAQVTPNLAQTAPTALKPTNYNFGAAPAATGKIMPAQQSVSLTGAGATPNFQSLTGQNLSYGAPSTTVNASQPPTAPANALSQGFLSSLTPAQTTAYNNALALAPSASSGGLVKPGTTAIGSTGTVNNPPTPPAPAAGSVGQTDTAGTSPVSQTNPQLGLIGGALGQTQNYYNQQQGLTQAGQNLVGTYAGLEGALADSPLAGGGAGIGSAKMAQLQNLEQSGLANIQQQQATLSGYEQPLAQTYQTGIGALSPQQQYVTPPAGQVSTNAATGQQVSNPVLAPVGTQAFYSPQPQGTAGQPQTAGQGGTNTGNTPFTGGQANEQAQLGQQYTQNNATILAAQGIQQKINSDISQNNLNPSAFNALNSVLQWAQGQQLSNTAYNNLANDLTDYAGTIAPLIGALGVQTDAKTYISQAMTAGSASGQTITQVLDNLNQLLLNKNAAYYKAGQGGAGQGATGTGQTSQNSPSTGTIQSQVVPGGSYVYDPTTGQWGIQR